MASKRKAPAKRASPAGKILVDVDIKRLGSKLTKQQKDLLKARVTGQVVTWIKNDVGESPMPVVTCNEHGPPHHPPVLEDETSDA